MRRELVRAAGATLLAALAGALAGSVVPFDDDVSPPSSVAEAPDEPSSPAGDVAAPRRPRVRTAAVEVGRDESVEIVEASARDLRVRVTDEDGRPLPAALVTSRTSEGSVGLAQIVGDTEHATVRTGSDGTAVLRVAGGATYVTASLGGATSCATADGDEVTIVLRGP